MVSGELEDVLRATEAGIEGMDGVSLVVLRRCWTSEVVDPIQRFGPDERSIDIPAAGGSAPKPGAIDSKIPYHVNLNR